MGFHVLHSLPSKAAQRMGNSRTKDLGNPEEEVMQDWLLENRLRTSQVPVTGQHQGDGRQVSLAGAGAQRKGKTRMSPPKVRIECGGGGLLFHKLDFKEYLDVICLVRSDSAPGIISWISRTACHTVLISLFPPIAWQRLPEDPSPSFTHQQCLLSQYVYVTQIDQPIRVYSFFFFLLPVYSPSKDFQ